MSRLPTRLAAALLSIAAIGSASAAKPFVPPPMPDGYDDPGPEPKDALAQIAAKLRTTLVDPYSIRGFILCKVSPSKADPPLDKHDEWRPAKWGALFALNVKNTMGGYSGQRSGTVDFREGKLDDLRLDDEKPTADIDFTLQGFMQKALEKCDRVSDDLIQEMIAQ